MIFFRHIIATSLMLLLSCSAMAAKPLSKDMVERFFSTMEQAEVLAKQYPVLENEQGPSMMLQGGKAFEEYVKKSGAYADFLKIVKKNGFSSVEEIGSLIKRITVAMYAAQAPQMGSAPDSEKLEQMLAQTKKQYLDAGLPEADAEKMLEPMIEMYEMFQMMNKEIKTADPADLAFVKKNIDYFQTRFSADDDDMAEEDLSAE
ncbi:hypothetical protein SAMN02745866_01473 [Alteromonadaceae bacterium Bs31]|nr:hypothetical protein SAMN02745866_01473 [Alteromonadaceae bacterium Bs31]